MYNAPMFQGRLSNKHYFEGWYYKIVDGSEKHTLAFIFGIRLDKKQNDSHVFIQFFNGEKDDAYYWKYDIKDFWASTKQFESKIGKTVISATTLSLDIDQPEVKIKGDLSFKNLVPWPKTMLAPSVMGIFSYFPFMECRHGLVSANHTIEGSLTLNGEVIDFNGGKGYTEKDYGRAFPVAYCWMQSNHFGPDPVSIMVSLAKAPVYGRVLGGFVCIFWFQGKVHIFATYNGAKLAGLAIEEKWLSFVITTKKYELYVEGIKEGGVNLPSPTNTGMNAVIHESLRSTLKIQFYDRSISPKRLLYQGEGIHAGLEIQGRRGDFITNPDQISPSRTV